MHNTTNTNKLSSGIGQISSIRSTETPSTNRNKDKALPSTLEFWESPLTQPQFKPVSNSNLLALTKETYLSECMEHPFLSEDEIRQKQFERIVELVELAFSSIPVYQQKYQSSGFNPKQLKSWDDIEKIPIITKRELIAAFPHSCLNPKMDPNDLFPTRSSGSSGDTLLIRVDHRAIVMDTIQGIRQFALQSGNKYREDDLLTHVYTVPWWYNNVNEKYRTAFISNVIPPERASRYLKELAPEIISCYPTNLEALVPYASSFNESLYLVVVHSEYSSKQKRMLWSQNLGCPVLDEYSSEEATRIALELPCGHYHVCDDAVHLEVVNPQTLTKEKDGTFGMAIVTNLLNEAMPFIRYAQGDYVTRPAQKSSCHIKWSQLESIDGRMNDSFINRHNRLVPAGSLLDITYRWMFDQNLHLDQFELIQKAPDLVEANFVLGSPFGDSSLTNAISHLEELLSICLEHPINVRTNLVKSLDNKTGKRRPIRCEVKL